MRMYRATIICKGLRLSKDAGEETALDIAKEFEEHRTWHKNVSCTWNGKELKLVAENDFDNNGEALLDEFGDCLAAYVKDYFDSETRIQSVNEI